MSTVERQLSRRQLIKGLAAAAIGTATGVSAHGYLYERHHLELVEACLRIEAWPNALDGVRIGLITDLHRSSTVSHQMIARAVSAVMARTPDLILLGGDYVTHRDGRYAAAAAEALSGARAPHGVFAVLGNHDDERHVPRALAARGFDVLADARTTVRIRGERLELAGLRYWTRSLATVARVVNGSSGPLVLLAHDPRRLIEAASLSVPLLLSGHTHGGQIVLPGLGAIAARKFPVLAGIGHRGGTTVFVSRGVGTVYLPVRVNCPPEVAILTLRGGGGCRT